jgi:hypothetical protein
VYYLGRVAPNTQTTAGATVDPLSLARTLQIALAVMPETEFFWLGPSDIYQLAQYGEKDFSLFLPSQSWTLTKYVVEGFFYSSFIIFNFCIQLSYILSYQ